MAPGGLISVFLIGLLSGVHCAAMCGGIVSALTMQLPRQNTVPGQSPGRGGAELAPSGNGSSGRRALGSQLILHLGYNLGRITSYAIAGALVGAVGGLGLMLNGALPIQMLLYVLANMMLIALGLYLFGVTTVLLPVERLGHRLW